MLVSPDDWDKYTTTPPPPNVATLLAAASQNIVDYCGWPIARFTATGEEYDGRGETVLSLRAMNLVEVHEVRVDGQPVTDFRVSKRYAQLQRAAGWPCGFGRVEVDYTAGYDPIPTNLAAVVVGLVVAATAVPVGVVSETVDRVTIRYRDAEAATRLGEFDRLAVDCYRLGPRP